MSRMSNFFPFMVFFISWPSNSDCHDFTTTRFLKTQVGGVAHCWILATNGTDRLVWSPIGCQREDPKVFVGVWSVPGIICEMAWTVMCKPYGFMSSWAGATWNFWNCYSWNTFSGKDFVFTLQFLLPQLPRARCHCSCIPQPKQPRLELGTKGPKHPTAMPGLAPSAVGLECMGHGGKGAIRPLGNHKWTLRCLFSVAAGFWRWSGGSRGGNIFPKSQ